MIRAVKINIYGKVQGVGFRYSTLQKANEMSVKGFVKNRMDGSVYIEAEAEPEILDKFILWCKKGPAQSYVKEIKVIDIQYNDYKNFSIK